MADAAVQRIMKIGSTVFRQTRTVVANAELLRELAVAPAKNGTLTSRTDANTGILTMAGGHGITTGAKLDVYFSGGMRRQMTVGTVTVNVVPIDLGSGDDLPLVNGVITAMIPVSTEFRVDGSDCVAIGATASKRAQVVLATVSNAEETALLVATKNIAAMWDSGDGSANPITGDVITQAFITHEDSTNTVTVTVAAAFN